jgi:hypothetical protein
MTGLDVVVALAAVLGAGALLGVEVWVVAIVALGYVASRPTVTAGVLSVVVATLAASALVYIGAAVALGWLAAVVSVAP